MKKGQRDSQDTLLQVKDLKAKKRRTVESSSSQDVEMKSQFNKPMPVVTLL
jgi:hypothetical protein